MVNLTRKFRWLIPLVVGVSAIAVVAAIATSQPLQGAAPGQGSDPPLTPSPVPTPTRIALGNPTNLHAGPTGHTGQVEVWWEPALNATLHWVWSARWDNTAGKWTLAKGNRAVVDGLEHWQDHWFRVVAGIDRGHGQYEWSEWSNWARTAPEWYPNPTSGPGTGIGDVEVQFTRGPEGQVAFAFTPCDGAPAATVPAVHGGGSPTGSSCVNGAGANFNLTPLVSSGHNFKIQMVCINRASDDCASAAGAYRGNWDIGFVERVKRRTRGQVQFEVSSFSELGVPHSDSLRLLNEGALQSAQIHPPHISRAHPIVDISSLWGLYPDQAAHLAVIDAVQPAMAELTTANGGMQVAYMITDSHYLFSRRDVHDDPDAWLGFRVRVRNSDLSNLMSGMGADPHSLPFFDPYGALQSGLVDGAIACAWCGERQSWYEVTDYIIGPFHNVPHSWLAIDLDIWNEMPPDLQNIILEEGARHAYLNRHLVLLSTEPEAVDHSAGRGVRYAPFSDRVKERMRQSAIESVVPRWVERVGGPSSEAVQLFNQAVRPIVNVQIDPDGSASAGD